MHKLLVILFINLMCEKLSYQIINTLAVNQAAFCYYQKFVKIILKKKTLVLVVASNAEMNFFELILDRRD